MSTTLKLTKSQLSKKSIDSLLSRCAQDSNLQNDKDVQIVINTGKKMDVSKDYIPRIIPLTACKLYKPKDLRILLITKDPSTLYRETISRDDTINDLIKEIISVKNLKRRFRGAKLSTLYKEFDLVVADYRVHHLLPDVLGSRFFHSKKKTPYMIRMSKQLKERRQKMIEECDVSYIRAQLKSICKNTSYIANNDNCLNVKIGEVGRHSSEEMLSNIQDIVRFLTDKKEKPQGGVIKGGINSIFVKTSNSVSLPVYQKDDDLVQEKHFNLEL
ncbi:hypothetical protein KAFR_0G00640 [Kazachstania africana CBS 2517]|uniref:Uncharacterized protein n=1 Tax=Kazachstania africana (strain ATCC 22294 / BCRC 22015 / CBS 2517 / CECT 1963 / NBRC 1671 / NRRL Y-8276) TaxID=1071382 RepID=H2AXJ7_KAZAF|nr:hypothetical protein KAFR_0G00640 [Kazachstania africana CBS 2517]CCF59097.1 hypothetical protein KAFR_0G00640 [Kazachstania africana CBS 2517]